jgi:hypothetical protein
MLFSFATFAVSLWLGLFAVACLRRLWRAAPNEGGYSSRDYPRATGGENHHRYRDVTPEGPISLARRSLVSISWAVINVIQAEFTRAFQWVSKIFRASAPAQDSVRPQSPGPVEIAHNPLRSQQAPQSTELVVSAPPDGIVGVARRKPAKHRASESAEPRLKSAVRRLGKNDNQRTEKAVRRVSKLRKADSGKESGKVHTVVTNSAKKTVRRKREIPSASNSSLTAKVSV